LGAVFAGVAVALATQLLLNLLGISVGAATLNPVEGGSPSATSLSIGAEYGLRFLAFWLPLLGAMPLGDTLVFQMNGPQVGTV
jgi:hypothetical protein